MSSEKNMPPPSYEQTGYGNPPPAGYPQPPPPMGYPGQPAGYQPVPTQGYPQGPPQPGYGQPPPPGAYPPGSYPPGQPGMQPQPGQPYAQQTVVVTQPGQPGFVVSQARPPDYLLPSLLACLCCFCPTGSIAIYYATRANSLAREGDMAEASRMANSARNMMITSVVLGICWMVLITILRLVVLQTSHRY